MHIPIVYHQQRIRDFAAIILVGSSDDVVGLLGDAVRHYLPIVHTVNIWMLAKQTRRSVIKRRDAAVFVCLPKSRFWSDFLSTKSSIDNK